MGMKGQVLVQYKTMSAEDQATFRRWLRLNVVVGFIIATGLVAMAVVGTTDQSTTNTVTVAAGKVATTHIQPNGKRP
jgi:siroheme synthase